MRIFEGKSSEALLTIVGLCLVLITLSEVFSSEDSALPLFFFGSTCLLWFLLGKIGNLLFRSHPERQQKLQRKLDKKLKSAGVKRLVQIYFKFWPKPQRLLQLFTIALILQLLGRTLQVMGRQGASTWEGILLLLAFTWGVIAGEKLYRAVPWLRLDYGKDEKATTKANDISVGPQTQKTPLFIKGAVLILVIAGIIGYFSLKFGPSSLPGQANQGMDNICMKYKCEATALLIKLDELKRKIINDKITYEEYTESLKKIKPLVKAFKKKYGKPGKETDSPRDELSKFNQYYSFYFICNSFDQYEFGVKCWKIDKAIPMVLEDKYKKLDPSHRWEAWGRAFKMIRFAKIILDRPCRKIDSKTRKLYRKQELEMLKDMNLSPELFMRKWGT